MPIELGRRVGALLAMAVFVVFTPARSLGQPPPLGQFAGHADIGPVKNVGFATYDPQQERYIISAAGTNMWDTKDEFNNWFPHIAPDGQSIVFLSYLPGVSPDDHPFYKQVYLRLMPYPAGRPKVIASVYGGQGTINVPSWSPDGREIALVSSTAGD